MVKKTFMVTGLATVLSLAMAMTTMAAPFDAAYYAEKNPDVVAAVGNDPVLLEMHYQTFGAAEGRTPNAVDAAAGSTSAAAFDAAYYAAQNPDVAALLGNDPAALLAHYEAFGKAEGRMPSAAAAAAKKSSSSSEAENPYARFASSSSSSKKSRSGSSKKSDSSDSSSDSSCAPEVVQGEMTSVTVTPGEIILTDTNAVNFDARAVDGNGDAADGNIEYVFTIQKFAGGDYIEFDASAKTVKLTADLSTIEGEVFAQIEVTATQTWDDKEESVERTAYIDVKANGTKTEGGSTGDENTGSDQTGNETGGDDQNQNGSENVEEETEATAESE